MFKAVSQRCLKLSGEVEALVRSDEVLGAQVEVVVEPVPQLEQDRLEVGDEFRVCDLRQSLLADADLCRPTLGSSDAVRVFSVLGARLAARPPTT